MAYSAFDSWTRMMTAGWGMAGTGMRLGETMVAAGSVVGHRSRTIAHAAGDPLRADHRELSRMGTEKADAFGRSGLAIAADLFRLQSDLFAQAADMTSLAMRGRLPSSGDAERLSARGARIMTRAMASGGRALAPVHAAATGNARRLGRKT